jgi:hypothetical protein
VLVLLVAVIAAALYVQSRQHEQPARNPPVPSGHVTYNFDCCTTADMDRALRPGTVAIFHWVASPFGTSAHPSTVTLSLKISGPFPNLESLKYSVIPLLGKAPELKAPKGVVIIKPLVAISARTIRTTTWAAHPPLMRLTVPRGTPSGWYDFQFTTASDGASVGAGGAIRVGAG